jgi:ParB family chromosome partitioning protein
MSETPEAIAPRKRPSGLGRGLSALLGDTPPVSIAPGGSSQDEAVPVGVRMVSTSHLHPMPNQPRRSFEEAPLRELAESIRSRGMLQPIIVREVASGRLQIIAGERRWRAAQIANIHQVPVIVREFDDKTALELAIIENVQREQLNAWEEGESYRRLIDEYGYTQDSLAKIVGKSRSHIANLMRLHNLPKAVHDWLSAGDLTMGHARALLASPDPVTHGQQVLNKGLSVRQTERLVKAKAAKGPPRVRGESVAEADIRALERQLSELIGLKIQIKHQGKMGSVTLQYSSLEQLDMICQRLSGERI